MKFAITLALVSLACILMAVFALGLDGLAGKVLIAFGVAFLISAGFRFADVQRNPRRRRGDSPRSR